MIGVAFRAQPPDRKGFPRIVPARNNFGLPARAAPAAADLHAPAREVRCDVRSSVPELLLLGRERPRAIALLDRLAVTLPPVTGCRRSAGTAIAATSVPVIPTTALRAAPRRRSIERLFHGLTRSAAHLEHISAECVPSGRPGLQGQRRRTPVRCQRVSPNCSKRSALRSRRDRELKTSCCSWPGSPPITPTTASSDRPQRRAARRSFSATSDIGSFARNDFRTALATEDEACNLGGKSAKLC